MGGLTVRAEIARSLPNESLVYFGDGANVPYGPRPREEIVGFVDEAVERLVDRNNVKMMVIACNAATGAAIDHLRATYDIPIIGMEPAVKPAALTTETGVIGVLATAAAFDGALYKATSALYRDSVKIIEKVGEGFVELVENERENTPEALETVRRAVNPMLAAGADRIVLGCTHYPFLAGQIGQVIGEFSAASGVSTTSPSVEADYHGGESPAAKRENRAT
jgi:glutamate racemase